jgi:hypothetical protein
VILADTSVWVDHLRSGDAALEGQLDAGEILMHPFVLGEISLGILPDRTRVLFSLKEIPEAAIAREEEVAQLIEGLELYGTGIGYVDAHLLVTVMFIRGATLWTRDKRLLALARQIGVACDEPEAWVQ